MNKAMKFIAILAATAMPVHTASAQSNCIPKSQVSALGIYLLPGFLKQAMTDCKKFLPASAGLLTKGPAAHTKYLAAAAKAEDQAALGVVRLAGDGLPKGIPGKFALPILEAMLVGEVAGSFDREICKTANNVWTPLSNLPADDLGTLAAAFLLLSREDDAKEAAKTPKQDSTRASFDDLNICTFIAR